MYDYYNKGRSLTLGSWCKWKIARLFFRTLETQIFNKPPPSPAYMSTPKKWVQAAPLKTVKIVRPPPACSGCERSIQQELKSGQGRSQPLTPGWARSRNISSIFPHFPECSLIFPESFFIFFLILVFRVGGSPTREGPGYATESGPKVLDYSAAFY